MILKPVHETTAYPLKCASNVEEAGTFLGTACDFSYKLREGLSLKCPPLFHSTWTAHDVNEQEGNSCVGPEGWQ